MNDKDFGDLRSILFGYAGFQTATALVVLSKADKVPSSSFILSLFALSIPACIFYPAFRRISEQIEEKEQKMA